jgi:hypothetical protein
MFARLTSFTILLFVIFLASCAPAASPGPEPGADNKAEYAIPTYTPRPIPTPLLKSDDGEIVLLMRKREVPFETILLRLSNECLLQNKECGLSDDMIGVLPQGLSQVLKVSWTKDGSRAFFWDENTTDVYVLDGNQGVFRAFTKGVLKTREDFLVSPNGESTIFEVQKNDNETDLVLMNNLSGDISAIDMPMVGAKYASQWMNDDVVLFWDEISEGKGYLTDRKVYTIHVKDQDVQPFDIGRDWMKTSVPVFSPNRETMAFATENQTIIRNASNAQENVWDIYGENLLWSPDSSLLAIYDSNTGIYTVLPGGSDLQEVYVMSSIRVLEDWIWLLDGKNLALIIVDGNGNRQLGVLSSVEKTLTPINLPLLNEYDPVSFSFRP